MDDEDDLTDTDENMSNDEGDEIDIDYHQGSNLRTLKRSKLKRSKGKWKVYYENRLFRREWIEMFPWVEEDHEDPKFAKCTACNKKIKSHKSILETHQKTKRHIKNISGCDDIDDEEEDSPKKSEKPEPKASSSAPLNNFTLSQPLSEQMVSEEQLGFFSESPLDVAHQAVTGLIDKLVEKYHENRLENLKMQNEAMMQLNQEKANLTRSANQIRLERQMQEEVNKQETLETKIKLMQQQHELKITAMENERDAKLKAVEQQLMFARQEYEKKVKLLDQQLQYIK